MADGAIVKHKEKRWRGVVVFKDAFNERYWVRWSSLQHAGFYWLSELDEV